VWSPTGRVRPLIGRPEVWADLLRRRERLANGVGGLTLLEGGSGVGKSTLLSLLAEQSGPPQYRVASAKAAWTENPSPFQLIGDAITSLTAIRKGGEAPFLEGSDSAPLAFQPAVERTRARFSVMDPLGSMDEDAPSELASDRLRLFGTMSEPFLAAAREGPVLVLLDDVHRADEPSRAFLLYILPQLAKLPIWILASCDRPKTEAGAAPDPLEAIRRRREVERVVLPPLSEAEVGQFVRWALPGRPLSEPEIHRLHTTSGGVPFRVVQLLSPSAAAARSDEGTSRPESVGDSHAGSADPEARRVLDLALVAGPEILLKGVAAAAGLTEARTAAHLEQLVAKGLIHQLEEGRFAFDSDETRDSLIAQISPGSVREYHRKLAEAILNDGSSGVTMVYSLARHAYLGGMDREAVEYNRRAASYAAESYQPEVSLLYLRLALEALGRADPADVQSELKLRLDIAVQQAHIGPAETAEALLEEIRNSERLWNSASPVDRALLGVYRARVLADQGRWDEAEASLHEMPVNLRGLDRGDIPRLAFRLQGEIRFYRGNYAEALEAHEAALGIAEQEGEPREVASEEIRRATVLSMIPGREPEALDGFRRAIDRLMELGDHSEAALGTLCLGVQLNALGRTDEARVELRRCVELSDAANDLRRSGWAHLNLADLEFGLGRIDEATAEARRAKARFERVEDVLGTARSALTEGRLALQRHQPGEAELAFEAARSLFAGRNLKADLLEVELRTVELEVARGDGAAARRRLVRIIEEGLALLRPDLVDEARKIGRRLDPPVADVE
jgi:tetratricopeptide (TPR) repeat protein